MEMERTVIYHANCADGFGAAYAAWKKFGNGLVVYKEMGYNEKLPYDFIDEYIKGKEVYILDFSFPREIMITIREQAAKLICLDHHETAQRNLEGIEGCFFDMNHSGAYLAWEFFFYNKPPLFIQMIEDRDLWRFQIEGSRALHFSMMAAPRTFKYWKQFHNEDFLYEMIKKGHQMAEYHDDKVDLIKKQAIWCDFDIYNIPVVNCPYFLASDVAGELAKEAPFAACWFQRKDGMFQYSLRSRKEGGENVAKLAERYGGGGHAKAAGFEIEELIHTPTPQPIRAV